MTRIWIATFVTMAVTAITAQEYGRPRAGSPGELRDVRPAGAVRGSIGDLRIASESDSAQVEFQLEGTGLYSAEISFRCDDRVRVHDRLGLLLSSGSRSGATQWRPGDLRYWFGNQRTLDPETGYRLYFWVDDEMLRQLPADRTLRLVFTRLDNVRRRYEGEFENRHLVNITLPPMVGRVHLRPPRPIAVEAPPGDNAVPATVGQTDVVQYRVNVTTPRLQGRMQPYGFLAEYRVPEFRGERNANVGGFLLQNGRWHRQREVHSSGVYDFIASPGARLDRDSPGVPTNSPEEVWDRFRRSGLLVRIDRVPTVRATAHFIVTGGERPAAYYIAELEDIRLNTVPDEREGAFWLKFDSLAALSWEEPAARGDNPFAPTGPTTRSLVQSVQKRIPFAHSGTNEGFTAPRIPLLAVPAGALEGKQSLAIASNPHYFHEMPVDEQARFIWESTEALGVIKGLITQDGWAVARAVIGWLIKASMQQNPDLYRSFGPGAFATDANRGWALRSSPERFTLRGASSGSTTTLEVAGTRGNNVAQVSGLGPNNNARHTHTATFRVRSIPGVYVEGARITVRSIRTKRDFQGHIKLNVGIIGHEGGREATSRQGLKMESAAVGTPFSYWVNTIPPRGPFDINSGRSRNITFETVDFENPDRDPTSLWEQLHHTFGPWAGIHLELALIDVQRRAGQTRLSPRTVTSFQYKDVGYLTVYPWDQLYDPTFGRLRNDVERDGDWLILRGRIEPHSEILDEAEVEIRLRVQARDSGPMIRMTGANQ